MSYPAPFGPRTGLERGLVERAAAAAAVAAPHASRHDQAGSFPEEGLGALAASGYLAAVLPRDLGGEGAGIPGLVLGNLALAKGDASLALVVAMHLTLLGRVRDAALWPAAIFAGVAGEVAAARAAPGALINSLATEPEMGSPSRGGLPATLATRAAGGWRIDGRKTFASGSPVLRWGVISAAAQDVAGGRLANFLVPLVSDGVRIEPSWDTLGMRATGSHAVVLDGVQVPPEAELPRPAQPPPGTSVVPYERAWSLIVTAVYLGVAEAARDEAVRFARERRPTALGGKAIASLPRIRQQAGRIDQQLYAARALLLATACAWDEAPSAHERTRMDGALAAAKTVVTNAAISVTEDAMRLVGGTSLDRALPLERHFRDVRGGLHHPPQDDAALELLAQAALDD